MVALSKKAFIPIRKRVEEPLSTNPLTRRQLMKKQTLSLLAALLLLPLFGQEKITYGKSTFTLYQPVASIPVTEPSGWAAPSPGYLLKQKGYGMGTYYCYAPGKISSKKHPCLYSELREWVYHTPETVEAYATKYNLTRVNQKTHDKMMKKNHYYSASALYSSGNKYFGVEYCESFYSDKKPYVKRVIYIERIPMSETSVIMNRAWSFWNDMVQLSDHGVILVKNHKAKTAPMNSHQTPPYFMIGEVLNLDKGFYTFAVENNTGTYQWHKYEPVFLASIAQKDFYLDGYNDSHSLEDPFIYHINMFREGNDVIIVSQALTQFLSDLEPGRTWQKEMQSRKENKILGDREMAKVAKQNMVSLERHYKEVFK